VGGHRNVADRLFQAEPRLEEASACRPLPEVGPQEVPGARRSVEFVSIRGTSVAGRRFAPVQVGQPLDQSRSKAQCSTSAMVPR
jgi:hypothetical protein